MKRDIATYLFRIWLGLILFACAITLLCEPLIYSDEGSRLFIDWPIVFAVFLLLVAYVLLFSRTGRRIQRGMQNGQKADSPFIKKLGCSLRDGFLVFSLGAFVLNMSYLLFHGYELHPAYELFHLKIVLTVARPLWDGIICRSANSSVLWLATVVVFDGFLGMLVALVLSPLRLLQRSRVMLIIIEILLLCGLWTAMLGGRLFVLDV
jgi:hypothetical protein